MDDRKASLVAAAFGSVAIGGFWLARPIKPVGKLRVVDQWSPMAQDGPDGDAAALFRVELRGVGRDEEHPILYQVVGKNGSHYPLMPVTTPGALNVLKLAKGYARRLDSPRLVATIEGRTVAVADLRPLPIPVAVPLKASPRPPVSLVLRGESGLFAEPKVPIPPGERWRLVARKTPFVDGLDAVTGVAPPEGRFLRRFSVPYPEEAGLVEVDLTRYRLKAESEVIHLPGLRLQRRFGGTAVVVDRPVRIPSRLGADIRLPQQDNGPRHPVRNGDPRVAIANVSVTPAWMMNLPPDLRRGRGVRIEVLGPKPESLGLSEFKIGSQSRKSQREPSGPLREGPFSATLRVTLFRPVPIATERMVLPITLGVPLPNAQRQWMPPSGFFPDRE